jgi:hypothetical protein
MVEVMINLVLILFFILLANVLVRSGDDLLRRLFDMALFVSGVLLLLAGIAFVLAGDEGAAQWQTPTGEPLFPFVTDALLLGILLQVTAVWQIALSVRSTRLSLARVVPVNADSAVHTLALILSGWLVSLSLIQLTQSSMAEIVEAVGAFELHQVVLEEMFFVLVALLGVGLFTRRSWREVRERVGLGTLSGQQLLLGAVWIVILVLVQAMAGAVWSLQNPAEMEQINELNLQLQGGLDSVGAWLVVAIAAGIGEELLFRGALQPVLGNLFTAALFALVHVQYGLFTPATAALFIIGLALGRLRQQHNTTLAILVHAGYNFVLGVMALMVAAAA